MSIFFLVCEEEMIRGLTQVAWERVDVSFHESKQRYIAHNTIQVSFKVDRLLSSNSCGLNCILYALYHLWTH